MAIHVLEPGDIIEWKNSNGTLLSRDIVIKVDNTYALLRPIPCDGIDNTGNMKKGSEWLGKTIDIEFSTIIKSELARLIYG